ncbi:MAG TPA: choice-of-anchor J domain-containing protein [Prolixibacteraceae bacterium]|nr:choice-of-anchor J domain-containing protein [Prolixibacteraceae bacterium]HPS12173.1 choice-of-anchor J domain-containing protein [Prolixibacteraceae bacterium]
MKRILLFFFAVCTAGFVSAQTGLYGTKSGTAAKNPSATTPSSLAESGNLLFEENMDNVSNLSSNGWLFYNVDGGGATTYFQGSTSVFFANNGNNDSYVAQNYRGANGSLIDQWLVTPAITSYGTTTFQFMARSTGNEWPDHISIYYSPTGSNNLADYVLLMSPTTLPGSWTSYKQTVTANGPVRFAVRYYETDGGNEGSNSDYWGMDAVQVYGSSYAVPVSKWWIASLFAFLGMAIVVKKVWF